MAISNIVDAAGCAGLAFKIPRNGYAFDAADSRPESRDAFLIAALLQAGLEF